MSRAAVDRQLRGVSGEAAQLHDSLARRADRARRSLRVTRSHSQADGPSQLPAGSSRHLLPPRPATVLGTMGTVDCAPSPARKTARAAEAAGWSAVVGSSVRSAVQRVAWRWATRHPPDRKIRARFGSKMVREGRYNTNIARDYSSWGPHVMDDYRQWLVAENLHFQYDTRLDVELGCELIECAVAAAAYTEDLVDALATQPKGGCPLRDFTLDVGAPTCGDGGATSSAAVELRERTAWVSVVLRVRYAPAALP